MAEFFNPQCNINTRQHEPWQILKLVGVGHCFVWQGYSSLLAIYNEIITVRGLVSALHGRVFQAQV